MADLPDKISSRLVAALAGSTEVSTVFPHKTPHVKDQCGQMLSVIRLALRQVLLLRQHVHRQGKIEPIWRGVGTHMQTFCVSL